jgi:hypothetical protein
MIGSRLACIVAAALGLAGCADYSRNVNCNFDCSYKGDRLYTRYNVFDLPNGYTGIIQNGNLYYAVVEESDDMVKLHNVISGEVYTNGSKILWDNYENYILYRTQWDQNHNKHSLYIYNYEGIDAYVDRIRIREGNILVTIDGVDYAVHEGDLARWLGVL